MFNFSVHPVVMTPFGMHHLLRENTTVIRINFFNFILKSYKTQ